MNNVTQNNIFSTLVNPAIPRPNNISPEVVKVLTELNVASIILADTGEVLEISKGKEKNTKQKKHKNKFGSIDPTIAGIDIGDKLLYVAIPDGNGDTCVKEFGSTTPDLRRIVEELKKAGVMTAAMEATGIYWVPLYEILEESGLNPVLVDAKAVKNAPSRKSDVVDCQWIQFLYSNGMLRKAFRPPRDRLKLRSYVRQRLNIIKTRQDALERLEKSLQLMNIKLSSALSDIGGVSGIAIMRQIAKGEKDPIKLAGLRSKRCKKSDEMFLAALTGNFQEEHIFALQQALELYDFANSQIEVCEKRIQDELETYPTVKETLPPNRDKDKKKNGKYAAARKPRKHDLTFDARALLWKKFGVDLTANPGLQASSALLILAELGGTDMSHWKNYKCFASWLRLCPGNNISGGKRRKCKREPCGSYISQALRMAAMAAKRSDSAIGSHIRRITGRTDKPKGIKAGAHKLSISIYHMCKNGWEYHERGAEAYEKAYEERIYKNMEKKAKQMGFQLVPIQPKV